MQRREFLKVFAGAAVAGPGIARAQAAMPVIGYLAAGSHAGAADEVIE